MDKILEYIGETPGVVLICIGGTFFIAVLVVLFSQSFEIDKGKVKYIGGNITLNPVRIWFLVTVVIVGLILIGTGLYQNITSAADKAIFTDRQIRQQLLFNNKREGKIYKWQDATQGWVGNFVFEGSIDTITARLTIWKTKSDTTYTTYEGTSKRVDVFDGKISMEFNGIKRDLIEGRMKEWNQKIIFRELAPSFGFSFGTQYYDPPKKLLPNLMDIIATTEK